MNFYPRHVGDYARDTGHLTMAEHGAYTLLLDHYYATEAPIPADLCERIAKAYADEERAAVQRVLKWFFVLDGEGYRHEKCDKIIAVGRAKSLKAKESAAARWANAGAMRTHSEGNANQKPLTKEKNPPKAPPKGGTRHGVEIESWLTENTAEDGTVFTADSPVFAYAKSCGLPKRMLRLAWLEFVDRMKATKKRYTDFRRAFLNYLRGNYLKLWWVADDGSFELTTAGKQAAIKHEIDFDER